MITLQNDGLLLRPPVREDLHALHALTLPDEMRVYLGHHLPSMADSFARLLRTIGCWQVYGYGQFMVIDEQSGAIIATGGLFHSWRGHGPDFDNQVEAGWIVAQSHWGQGLATRMMTAAQQWFDKTHGPRRTVCMIEKGHGGSEKVAKRLGYLPYRQVEGDATSPDARPLILYERIPVTMADSPSR